MVLGLTATVGVATFMFPWYTKGVWGSSAARVPDEAFTPQRSQPAGLSSSWAIQRVFEPMTDPNAIMNDFWRSVDEVPNHGMVAVETADGGSRDWGVSMWHQLHCLGLFRALLTGETHHHGSPHRREEDDGSASASQEFGAMHWVHCLDYLAQVSLPPFHGRRHGCFAVRMLMSC